MGAFGAVLAAGGPWAVAGAMGVSVLFLMTSGRLITRSVHEERLEDKQQLVDFYEETATKALATLDTRGAAMSEAITKLTEALNTRKGSAS